MRQFLLSVKRDWLNAFYNKAFVAASVLAFGVLISMSVIASNFYHFIEHRTGTSINDRILQVLPVTDVSVPIFIIIWATISLYVIRSIKDPSIFISLLVSYTFFTIIRWMFIYLVPLEPPMNLVELRDPFTNIFYGGYFITKDLFFSGHVGTVFLVCLGMKKKNDKKILAIGAIILAVLLMVQRVHYSIDVICAPFFSLLAYQMGKLVLQKTGVIVSASQPVDLSIRYENA